jgi:hypothetical protein
MIDKMTIINERGFLNDEGKKAVGNFLEEAHKLFSLAKNHQEIETLSSILNNLVGSVAFEKKKSK